jgi:hypothetical protein
MSIIFLSFIEREENVVGGSERQYIEGEVQKTIYSVQKVPGSAY